MAVDSRRLSILSAQEVDELYGLELYGLPRFTEDDRSLYFDLGPAERELVAGVFTFSVAVHLVLQLGYFKAKRQFFVYSLDSVKGDVAYIVRHHFQARDEREVKAPSRSTRLEQQQIILKLFDYRLCDAAAKAELDLKAQRVAMLSAQQYSFCRRSCSTCRRSASSHPDTPTCRIWLGGLSPTNVCASPVCSAGC
jgi:hypothetical protein